MTEGKLFVAVHGTKENGADYIAEAVQNGACAVICEEAPPCEIPYVLVPNAYLALSQLACAWYGEPSIKLKVIGVTGTNGKTTTTYLLKQLLEYCTGARVGLIGTNQNMIGDKILPTERTTPNALTLQSLLAQMAEAKCRYAVMEVSSHALMQYRTFGICFAVGIFTNLTQDHLDYHGTIEAYCDAKARLFLQCDSAVVNGDDKWSDRLLADYHGKAIRFGQSLENDLVGWRPQYKNDCVRFTAVSDIDHIETSIAIPGAFSLYNALGALAALQAIDIPLGQAAKELPNCHGVRGRCEVVPVPAEFTVIIDYAHTPDGVRNILSTVCSFADGRVIAVLGCGGDRDQTKRPLMAHIAAALADFVVLSSDNPRTENPYAILHGMLSGMKESQTAFAVIEDRCAAIHYALSIAQKGDVVVLCGKGHETYQIIGTESRHLDEREIVQNYFT